MEEPKEAAEEGFEAPNAMRMIGTDSWDINDLEDPVTAEFLDQQSFVVIPESNGERLCKTLNFTKHFEKLSPINAR